MAFDKAKSLMAEYMKGIEDPDILKKLAEISSEIEKSEEEFTGLQDQHAKMKDDYIEALKHSSFKDNETPIPDEPKKSSFEEAAEKLRKELEKNGK